MRIRRRRYKLLDVRPAQLPFSRLVIKRAVAASRLCGWSEGAGRQGRSGPATSSIRRTSNRKRGANRICPPCRSCRSHRLSFHIPRTQSGRICSSVGAALPLRPNETAEIAGATCDPQQRRISAVSCLSPSGLCRSSNIPLPTMPMIANRRGEVKCRGHPPGHAGPTGGEAESPDRCPRTSALPCRAVIR
jgi:hypothetical protein